MLARKQNKLHLNSRSITSNGCWFDPISKDQRLHSDSSAFTSVWSSPQPHGSKTFEDTDAWHLKHGTVTANVCKWPQMVVDKWLDFVWYAFFAVQTICMFWEQLTEVLALLSSDLGCSGKWLQLFVNQCKKVLKFLNSQTLVLIQVSCSKGPAKKAFTRAFL